MRGFGIYVGHSFLYHITHYVSNVLLLSQINIAVIFSVLNITVSMILAFCIMHNEC